MINTIIKKIDQEIEKKIAPCNKESRHYRDALRVYQRWRKAAGEPLPTPFSFFLSISLSTKGHTTHLHSRSLVLSMGFLGEILGGGKKITNFLHFFFKDYPLEICIRNSPTASV